MRRPLGIVATIVISGSMIAASAPAFAAGEERDSQLLHTLAELTPGVGEAQLRADAEAYARETGLSAEQVLEQSVADAEASIAESNAARSTSAARSSGASGGGTVVLGAANNKGDIFVSPAATGFVQHGHTGIYYSTSTIVEAPGTGKKSQASAASSYRVGKGAVKQSVSVTATKRGASANHAYNKLRGKDYNVNFAFNKDVSGAQMNCSQLVWAAYKVGAGIDLDSNGGPGVYPYNIKDSSYTSTYRTL